MEAERRRLAHQNFVGVVQVALALQLDLVHLVPPHQLQHAEPAGVRA